MKYFFFFFLWNLWLTGNAQTPQVLSIEDCYSLARQNYPLVKQQDLILKSKEYSIQNASKGYLPQISILGQATYQSDVTQIPIDLLGIDIPTISKDQYRIYGELSQTLFDGGIIKAQKQALEAKAKVEEQHLEVELYKLNNRVNQLFFGILLVDEQLKQQELLQKDIQLGITKIQAAIANGIAFKSSADVLKAELLKAGQHTIGLKSMRKAYITMLGLLINKTLDENTVLVKPQKVSVSQQIQRPELLFYASQNKSLDIQYNLLTANNLPKFNLFLQGGLGRPGFNMLSNDFTPFYIGGIRLNWPLSGLYTLKKSKALIDIDRKKVDLQKELFLFNTNFTIQQQDAEINKAKTLLSSDDAIIALRLNIKNAASAQLENGIINSNDYLREVNAEDQARQNKILHEIQLLIAQYNLKWTVENGQQKMEKIQK